MNDSCGLLVGLPIIVQIENLDPEVLSVDR